MFWHSGWHQRNYNFCICVGILWNLSSKDNLKEKLARETLPELTDKILIPLSNKLDSDGTYLSPSESDIFNNTTGCLRCTSLICLLPSVATCSFIIMYIFWFSWACFFSHDHISICRTCSGRTLKCRLTAIGAFFLPHPTLLALFEKGCITPAPACFGSALWKPWRGLNKIFNDELQ